MLEIMCIFKFKVMFLKINFTNHNVYSYGYFIHNTKETVRKYRGT